MSTDYPSDWDSRRKKVYKRDDYGCAHCGINGGPHGNAELHAHHIVPKSRGGSDNISNLITLCNECHKAVHSKNRNPRSPDGHTAVVGQGRQGTDWGTLADAIVEDICGVFDEAAGIGNAMTTEGMADAFAERYFNMRFSVLQITDALGQLEQLSTRQYPSEVVQTNEEVFNIGVEIAKELLDYYGTIYEQLEEVIEAEVTCSECGAGITQEMNFCGECGSEVEIHPTCPSCTTQLEGEFKFCPQCGEDLSDIQWTETSQMVDEASRSIEKMAEYIENKQPQLEQALTKRNRAINNHTQF